MSETVGIIGLGRAGSAAARAFIKEGFNVVGFDIDVNAINAFVDEGGVAAVSPADVARNAKAVLVLVLSDEQVSEVLTGKNGVLEGSQDGSVVICMSTIQRTTLRRMAEASGKVNAGFLDCPFTGGPARISNKSLTLIVAGVEELVRKVSHILVAIGKIVYVGSEPGQAQAVKHCNQLLAGVTHAATMEVIALARRLGLDPALVASVAGSGIAGSDYFRLLADSVLNKTPSPGGLGQMCKDMKIVSATLQESGFSARVALAASDYFQEAQDRGMEGREGADLISVVDVGNGQS